MKIQNKNIFILYLELLNIKHTTYYSTKFYNEHPHKYNLFGLSKMLLDYGIKNQGIRLKNKKQDIFSIETPFITHFEGDFALVTRLDQEKIHYIWNGQRISISTDVFIEGWSGVLLLADHSEKGEEPYYSLNKKIEKLKFIKKGLLLLFLSILFIFLYITNKIYNDIGQTLNLLINMLGIYISLTLVLKQSYSQSNYIDKICSIFKKSDCNNILESKAAKLWGVIGWSEIGLGYFVANTLMILLFPELSSYTTIINISILPYTLWSIWYQKIKAKLWCPLCLVIQILLWMIFLCNLLFSGIYFPIVTIPNLIIVMCIYTIPILVINNILPQFTRSIELEHTKWEINSLKTDEEIFIALLKKQPYYNIDKKTSRILWGNPQSDIMVTILTNPYCNPCAYMHERIENLLKNNEENICIQYIFSYFNKELSEANKYLIASYLKYDKIESQDIFGKWFSEGKTDGVSFFKKYDLNINNESIIQEFELHENWGKNQKISHTPAVLINGYLLPLNYKVEDIKYFANIKT